MNSTNGHSGVVGRFAPSPTGRMHIGNVYCALVSWLSARSRGGRWLLRIEDLDASRSRDEWTTLLLTDLEWLGLYHDGDIISQSDRSGIYAEALARLDTYPCYCTRADLLAASAPHVSDGRHVYAGTCRHLTPEAAAGKAATGRRPALRLVMPDTEISFTDTLRGRVSGNAAREWGDIVVRRSDGGYAYQLATAIDDALTGVTEVVRGVDLLASSLPQNYIRRCLGLPSPTYLHIPLLCNAAGQRLCKRDRALDLGELRKHFTAEEIIGRLAFLAGLTTDASAVTADGLLRDFSPERLPKADAVVVPDELFKPANR